MKSPYASTKFDFYLALEGLDAVKADGLVSIVSIAAVDSIKTLNPTP